MDSSIKECHFQLHLIQQHTLADMDVISTTFNGTGDLESMMTTDPAAEDTNSNYKYVFIPILLIQIIITVVSNGILFTVIVCSFRSCTSLNIFLLSISTFNLLTTVNQISLVVFNFQPLTTNFPQLLCYLVTVIKATATVGTILVHLFISYHRYKIAIRPLKWKKRRKQAWLLGIVTWAIASAIAIFECILHFSMGNGTTLQSCLWPGVSQCSNIIRLYSQLLTLACLSVASGMTCYFYCKTSRILKELEMDKEYERKINPIEDNRVGRRKLTTAERAVVSLFTIFTIHCITQLPIYIYDIIISSMAQIKHHSETAEAENVEDAIPAVSTMPILLLLTTIGFLTTGSPLILACINRQFKQRIKSILQFISGSKDQSTHQIQARFQAEPTPSSSPVPPPTPAPRNIQVFFGSTRHSSYNKSNIARYIKPNNDLEVLGAADSLRPERVSEPSLHVDVSRSPRPSGISTTSSSVGRAAASTGLVLSAPGHRVLLNNYFCPDPDEVAAEQLEELYF